MGAKKKLTGNELIANFMNLKCKNSYNKLWMPSGELNFLNSLIHDEMENETWYVTTLRFDESWDWLIPVIDKIYSLDIYSVYVNTTSGQFENSIDINTRFIRNTYEQVIEFIKWYNERK